MKNYNIPRSKGIYTYENYRGSGSFLVSDLQLLKVALRHLRADADLSAMYLFNKHRSRSRKS